MDRRAYAAMYGPTTGDKVALGDTGLVIEVERDLAAYGDECVFGGVRYPHKLWRVSVCYELGLRLRDQLAVYV